MGIKNLTEAEEKEFYRLVGKMNGEKPDKEQGVKVRKPRQSEEYFCISNDGAVIQSRWTNDSLDEGRWELGNVFFTEESAWLAREKRKVEVELERYEPKKMTRSEVEKAIVAYCDPVGTPCKECKCYKKCVKRMPFEWLSNEGLQEYYQFLYGIKVEVKE